LRKEINGTFTDIAEQNPFTTAGSHKVRLEADDTTITYFRADANALVATDQTDFQDAGHGGILGYLYQDASAGALSAWDFRRYEAATGDDEERDIILAQNRIIRQTNQVLWHGVH